MSYCIENRRIVQLKACCVVDFLSLSAPGCARAEFAVSRPDLAPQRCQGIDGDDVPEAPEATTTHTITSKNTFNVTVNKLTKHFSY